MDVKSESGRAFLLPVRKLGRKAEDESLGMLEGQTMRGGYWLNVMKYNTLLYLDLTILHCMPLRISEEQQGLHAAYTLGKKVDESME